MRQLPIHTWRACLIAAILAATLASAPSVEAARPDPVKRTVTDAFARGGIDAQERDRYLGSWSAALRTYRLLGGQRRKELGYVIGTVRSLAARKGLAGRLAPMFLILGRNREWWSKAGPPASGARLRFGSSRVIFQYFPGEGLQLHPLANFGQVNGYWYQKRNGDLRSLVDDLLALRVDRGGFVTWEYYFGFGGGKPPWISGMAQGTAMQALARASTRLSDPSLLEVAKRARGAFERRTPIGVRARQGSKVWYPLYSFAPRLNVLNGMLQAVNGIRTYDDLAQDPVARQLFEAGDRTARAVIGSFDTGAWSLYNRPGGRPGHEANLNYHTLNRDFARNLCKATSAAEYCTTADNFTQYMKEDPTLDPYRAVPSPGTGGKGLRFRFKLSKIGRVGIVVKDSASGKTYLSTNAPFSRGEHYFRWVPPKFDGEHTYTFTLYARDLAGNSTSAKGEIRVKPRRGG
jgi:D-glucuronyl C5-epimerase-like protein